MQKLPLPLLPKHLILRRTAGGSEASVMKGGWLEVHSQIDDNVIVR